MATVVIDGLARLVEGQRRVAEEFGVSQARLFPRSASLLDGRSAHEALRGLFRRGSGREAEVANLLEDLIAHQIALVEALDAVSLATLDHLDPDRIEDLAGRGPRLPGSRWRLFREQAATARNHDHFRLQQIVAQGVLRAFGRAWRLHSRAAARVPGRGERR